MPPSVVSISYAGRESSYAPETLRYLNTLLQLLALHGVTVVAAAGDAGAFGGIGGDGNNNNNDNNNGGNGGGGDGGDGGGCDRLTPLFPASSPWVLSVGASQQVTLHSNPDDDDDDDKDNNVDNNDDNDGVGDRRCITEVAASTATGARITTGGGFR